MKEEVYLCYSEGDPTIKMRDDAMEVAMPTAEAILAHFNEGIDYLRKHCPTSRSVKEAYHLDLNALKAAREIWKHMRNPYVATNDASHPNNWTRHQLLALAGIIQTNLGIPVFEKDVAKK